MIAIGNQYFSQISWATALHIPANGHCLQSSSIEAMYTFAFLGEHVHLTKQPAMEKATNQGLVSRNTRKAICKAAIRLFWKADLLRCFQHNKRQKNCEV